MSKSVLKATHEGEIDINGFKIKSYNLENGERVLSRIDFLRALGRTGKAKGGRQYDEEFELPVFLTANNLKPFISSNLTENSAPINFIDLKGNKSIGYKAQLLPSVCYVFIDADDKNVLQANQKHIVDHCKKLIRGFATVGIIALVDEATGYQYKREKDELQKILKAYIAEELLPWQKRFPDIFYREIFRLNGWDFTVDNIRNRPGVVGTWTKKLIYEQLPKGVLEELQKKTPKSSAGNYTARFFQSLTEDVGDPALQAQISAVIALFQISDNWGAFLSNFNKMVGRRKGQLELKLEDLSPLEKKIEFNEKNNFNSNLKGLLNTPPPDKKKK